MRIQTSFFSLSRPLANFKAKQETDKAGLFGINILVFSKAKFAFACKQEPML